MRIQQGLAIAIMTVAIAVMAAPAIAADIFLQIDGITGESQDSQYKGTIEISSFALSASQSGASTATGAGAGKGVTSLTVVKQVDGTSAALLQHCAKGTHFDKVFLYVRKAGGAPAVEYLMTDVLISSIQTSSNGAQPTETVTLKFQTIQTQTSVPPTNAVPIKVTRPNAAP